MGNEVRYKPCQYCRKRRNLAWCPDKKTCYKCLAIENGWVS